MPYVNVPNDLSKIKTKLAFNLTKRQLVCFGIAAAVGIPSYLLARSAIGNTGAMFLMMAVALPAFLLAMYEKDGLPFGAERPAGPFPAAWGEALPDGKYLCSVYPAGRCEKGGCDCKKQTAQSAAPERPLTGKLRCLPSRRSLIW